jgi:hypothetical protein
MYVRLEPQIVPNHLLCVEVVTSGQMEALKH